MKRGEIYYVMPAGTAVGSEQWSGRPAIIVSNDRNNAASEVVMVVYLTTRPKTDLPTHVSIRSADRMSTALCEQVWTVSTQRIGNRMGMCTPEEMQRIDSALAIALDLPTYLEDDSYYDDDVEESTYDAELYAVRAELEVCKTLLDGAINKISQKGT